MYKGQLDYFEKLRTCQRLLIVLTSHASKKYTFSYYFCTEKSSFFYIFNLSDINLFIPLIYLIMVDFVISLFLKILVSTKVSPD